MKKIEIKHKAGKHYPPLSTMLKIMWWSLFKPNVSFIFTEESKYDIGNTDQLDWNKTIGKASLAYRFKTKGKKRAGHKKEQILVWRFNKIKNVFEYTKYWREDYQFNWHKPVEIKPNLVTPPIKTKGFFKSFKAIPPHFGGNKTPNRNISYCVILH